ncbi:beta-ketoacyl-ACP synthase II [Bermanella sp. R86510]|uniref:beta-ketoacyl-ACP synthase II n=1 Tax=unclassified Bermanella TaxID=2627862 RepID=UPI0037C6E45D
MSKRRVVVTGIGAVTPLANNASDTWSKLLAGESGIETITHFDASALATQFAGTVKNFDFSAVLSPKEAKKMDTFIHYGMVACAEAIAQAGIDSNTSDGDRIGCALGSGIGGLQTIEHNHLQLINSGPRRVSPFYIPSAIVNMLAGHVAMKYGYTGPNFAISTACTTGTHNIGYGARTIAYGDADVMIVGGAEAACTPSGMAGFSAARAMSTRNDDPAGASRPWDKGRDGFVLGDGAGALVLEEYEHAKKRGATILAEVSGFGMSDDAYHMTSPPEDGAGAAKAMANALKDANISGSDIQYVNAHGTSTPQGDIAESRAIESVIGDHTLVSSSKSMTGHLLGAAGAIEAVFCIQALQSNKVPPTINLHDVEDGCNLDYVANTARDVTLKHVLSNSFGFGGTNGSLIFSRV